MAPTLATPSLMSIGTSCGNFRGSILYSEIAGLAEEHTISQTTPLGAPPLVYSF